MAKKDDGKLIREDLLEEMFKRYIRPSLTFQAKPSSTGRKPGDPYNSLTLRVSAGGVWGGPLMSTTGTVSSSGIAGSATSSTPSWKQIPYPTSHNWKGHLVSEDDDAFGLTSLCGREAHWSPMNTPKPKRMCKRCVSIFEKNVLEGRYEG